MSTSKVTPQKEYRTARLLFQARLLGHAGQLFSLVDCSREHLRPWMPWEKHTTSVNDSLQYLKKAIDDWNEQTIFDYSVFEISSGKMIGSFGLHTIQWNRKSCELGYWLGAQFQGQGFASESVKLGEDIALEIGLHRVVIACDRLNQRSQQVARRNGYRLEAKLIDHAPSGEGMQDTMQFVKFVNPRIENQITENLPAGYAIQICDGDEFDQIVGPLKESIYDNTIAVWPRETFSAAEKEKLKEMNKDYQKPYFLYLVLLYRGKLAGWAVGYQENRESFCMCDSAVLPEHRGRGLYSYLLDVILKLATERGFQRITSLHQVTNNAIILPKLKKGFLITGTSVNDAAGVMVQLTYFTNPLRRQILEFRVGALRPTEDMKKLLKL